MIFYNPYLVMLVYDVELYIVYEAQLISALQTGGAYYG